MKNSMLLVLALVTIMLTFNSCRKGDTGPQGPTGNANVIGTNTITVSSWNASGHNWTADLLTNAITPDIVDYGSVQVFIQYGNEWWALPDINGVNVTQFGFSDGYVSLLNSNTDDTQALYPGVQTFRIVIISSSNAKAHPDMNWNNYEEIKQTYSIIELKK